LQRSTANVTTDPAKGTVFCRLIYPQPMLAWVGASRQSVWVGGYIAQESSREIQSSIVT
jgi:hypothetical protein